MSLTDSGPAAILVYGGGRLEAAFLHAQDGGEAYMGPLLRKAVQYAKTHYDSGNIVDVIMSEGEMRRIDGVPVPEAAANAKVRHVYYVTYRWDSNSAKKTYRVKALHIKTGQHVGATDVPTFADEIPATATHLA